MIRPIPRAECEASFPINRDIRSTAHLATQHVYGELYDRLVEKDADADTRDAKAVKKIAVGYMKLLFPHWMRREQVDLSEFEQYCLRPAVRRRGIIKEQCHRIDPEFKPAMPNFRTKA